MKIKRIFAIIAVVLLVALYGSTIVFAMSDSPNCGLHVQSIHLLHRNHTDYSL